MDTLVCCFIALLFGLIQPNVHGQNVVGCGGFVESDVPIKFERVEMKLYTKQGVFKSKTECTPNNGYFLVAIYDKGEYVLKISPPEGWGFEPKEMELNIDGVTDPCTKTEDLNFKFSGFTVNGKIGSIGHETGPSGVKILLLNKEGKSASETVSGENGSYEFIDIMPGEYVLKASHPIWLLTNNDVAVKIVDDNVKIEEDIVVSGYDVKGHVLSSGEPIQDVSFVLLTSEKKDLQNCQPVPNDVLQSIKLEASDVPLCMVKSQADGSFTFPSVPTGSYNLVPFYTAQNIVFDIVPSKLAFSVNLKSVMMMTPFQVYGFSVKGKVLDAVKTGISDVKVEAVSESGEIRQAITTEQGQYMLENITTGIYTFRLSKKQYVFKEKKIHISPNVPTLKDITATEYGVCGFISIKQIPTGVRQLNQLRVLLQPVEKGEKTKSITVDKEGKFCFTSKPGKFKVQIPIVEDEVKAGLALRPSEHSIEIVNQPINNLVFEQFLATVSGTIECIEKCSDVSVYLMASESSSQDKLFGNVDGEGKNLVFNIPNVLPGKYKVVPQRKKWCWDPQHIELNIKDEDINNIKLIHLGYLLKCSISHNIALNFALENSKEEVGSFDLKRGKNKFCLKTPGTYVLKPVSCYRFEQEKYIYNTAEPKALSLNVASYKMEIKVKAGKNISDLVVAVRSKSTNKVEELKPVYSGSEGGLSIYQTLYWGSLSQEFELTPKSKEVLFSPSISTIIIAESCPGANTVFEGHEGIFIQGKITPPFAGVTISIKIAESANQDSKTIDVLTDNDGSYRIGPMHGDTNYEVSAVKDGYLITPVTDQKGSFLAQKLGHIFVTVKDENNEAMENVFLSLSGKQYRNNNLTKTDGSFLFPNLGPGEYFLRAMQKEYDFQPTTTTIKVLEGEDVNIDIQGKRVAFSCTGSVATLAGVPEENVGVEAIGLHKCSEFQESTVSDENGNYRIRGLQPGCSYNIRLMKSAANEQVERLAPENQVVQVQQEDITKIHFLVFMKPTKFQVTAQIETDFKLLPTLKVLLYEEENMDSPIHSIAPNVVKFIQFPPLKPMTYIIKIQSSLSSRTHDIVTSTATVKPGPDLQKQHVKLQFDAKEKKIDLEPTQSVITLPLAVAFIFLAYNYDAVIGFLIRANLFFQSFNKSEKDDESEDSQDEILNMTSSSRLMKKKKR